MRQEQPSDEDLPSEDLRKRTFSTLGGASAIMLIDRVLQLAFLTVLARLLTPEQTAAAAAAGAVVSLATILNSFGIPAHLIQARSLSVSTMATARTTLLLTAITSIGVVEILAPLAGMWFRNPDVTAALRVMALILLAPCLAAPAFARLSRDLRARDAAIAELLATFAGTALVTIPLALVGFGFWSLTFGAVAQVAARVLLLCLFAKQPIRFQLGLDGALALCGRGSGFMLSGMLRRAYYDCPKWIIGRFLPVAGLGLYSRANSLAGYPASLFGAAVDRVIFPAVARVQSEAHRLRHGLIDAVQLTAVIGLPLTVALFLLGPDIIRVLLGPAWEGAAKPFGILCLTTYFLLADRLNWAVMRGLGRTYRLAALQAVLFLLMIGCSILGVRHGLVGVAAAVTGVMTLGYLAASIMAMTAAEVTFKQWFSAQYPGVMCGFLAALVLTPLVTQLHALAASSILVIAVCSATALIAGGLAARLAPTMFVGSAGKRVLVMLDDMVSSRRRSTKAP